MLSVLETLKLKTPATGVAFHPTSPGLFTLGTIDGKIHFYNVESAGKVTFLLERTLDFAGGVRALSWSANGTLAVGLVSRSVMICRPESSDGLQSAQTLGQMPSGVMCLRWLTENVLAVGDEDGHIRIFDTRLLAADAVGTASGSACVAELDDCDDSITAIEATADTRKLYAISGDKLAVFDLTKAPSQRLLAMSDELDDDLAGLCLDEDEKRLLVGFQSTSLAVFNAGDYGDIKEKIPGIKNGVASLLKISDGEALLGTQDGNLHAVSLSDVIKVGEALVSPKTAEKGLSLAVAADGSDSDSDPDSSDSDMSDDGSKEGLTAALDLLAISGDKSLLITGSYGDSSLILYAFNGDLQLSSTSAEATGAVETAATEIVTTSDDMADDGTEEPLALGRISTMQTRASGVTDESFFDDL